LPLQNCTYGVPKRAVTHAHTASKIPPDRTELARTPRDAAAGRAGDTRYEEDAMSIFERFRGGRGAVDGEHELAANAVMQLPRGRGRLVRVVAGQVVVTRAGDPEDHVLEAGAELDLAGYGRVLAWALQPSRLEVRRITERADVPAEVALAR
jgi:hypothetical protein